jgi:hypothetical protein
MIYGDINQIQMNGRGWEEKKLRIPLEFTALAQFRMIRHFLELVFSQRMPVMLTELSSICLVATDTTKLNEVIHRCYN